MTSRSLNVLALAAAVLLDGSAALAQSHSDGLAAGSYRCMSYNVSGAGAECANFPRLVLDASGTYEYSSTKGQWTTIGDRLYLSASELWGPGLIVGRDAVRFEYDYNGRRITVNWVCAACSTSVPASGRTESEMSAGVKSVGVTLTLQFAESIGGVSGYVIVPADAARTYEHNAPLPPGAVMGLASETSSTSVRLATNSANTLLTGRQYVVFLSWPRESIPVAILDLPSVNNDYTTTLNATLDGSGVLARAGRR